MHLGSVVPILIIPLFFNQSTNWKSSIFGKLLKFSLLFELFTLQHWRRAVTLVNTFSTGSSSEDLSFSFFISKLEHLGASFLVLTGKLINKILLVTYGTKYRCCYYSASKLTFMTVHFLSWGQIFPLLWSMKQDHFLCILNTITSSLVNLHNRHLCKHPCVALLFCFTAQEADPEPLCFRASQAPHNPPPPLLCTAAHNGPSFTPSSFKHQ